MDCTQGACGRASRRGPRVVGIRSGLIVALGMLLVGAVGPAWGGNTQHVQARIASVAGGSSPITFGSRGNGLFRATERRGGKLRAKLAGLTDATGFPIDALGNTLHVDLVVNGVPQSVDYPFDLVHGRARVGESLGLVNGDSYEISNMELRDPTGVPFGVIGIPAGWRGNVMKASLVEVVTSPGSLGLLKGAGAQIRIKNGTAHVQLSLSKVIDANGDGVTTSGNRVEFEYDLNGVGPNVLTIPFDLVDGGTDLITGELAIGASDVLRTRRIDVFDSAGNRFVTLGVRVLHPSSE